MNDKELITGVIFVTLAILIYFLPGLIASRRNHRNMMPIFLLNLFLGWTFIGWITAFIWSFSANTIEDNSSNKPKNNQDHSESGYKLCPYCAEEIKVEAVICKHCRSELTL